MFRYSANPDSFGQDWHLINSAALKAAIIYMEREITTEDLKYIDIAFSNHRERNGYILAFMNKREKGVMRKYFFIAYAPRKVFTPELLKRVEFLLHNPSKDLKAFIFQGS